MPSLKRKVYKLFGALETLSAGAFFGAVVLGMLALVPTVGDFIPDVTADRWGAAVGFFSVLALMILRQGRLTRSGHH